MIAYPLAQECRTCVHREECGGYPPLDGLFGCTLVCETNCKSPATCKWTCIRNPSQWIERWREVGGTDYLPTGQAFSQHDLRKLNLPSYLPQIDHGSGRVTKLKREWVAVPLRSFAFRKDFLAGEMDAAQLRSFLKLSEETKIVVSGVANDGYLEKLWSIWRDHHLASKIARLELAAVTLPNYSFFNDAPRGHGIWNRHRMLRLGESLVESKVTVIPHLNALTSGDWNYWASFFSGISGTIFVAKEFQTGNRKRHVGLDSLSGLENLQTRLGVELHPVLFGATAYRTNVAKAFKSFTLVDATPFMKTVHRHMLYLAQDGNRTWDKWFNVPGSPIDAILRHNINEYSRWLGLRSNAAL